MLHCQYQVKQIGMLPRKSTILLVLALCMYLGQNVAYDETKYKYEDEAIYEVPT